jgi:hypothetical protein
MSLDSIVVQGTLKPDGSLELDTIPALAPGRVYVTLQPVPSGPPSKGGLASTIAEIRRFQQAHGYLGRTPEEIAQHEAERRADDEAYEQRMQEIWSRTQAGASTGGP